MAKEIERKFIITELPKGFEVIRGGEAFTWYLSVEPEERLRIVKDYSGDIKYQHAHKSGKGLSREEVEVNLTEEEFNKILDGHADIKDKVIRSRWFHLKYRKYILEVMIKDIDKPKPFMVLEVEFENEREAMAFVLPDSIHGMDVTFVEDYKMRNYWKRTRLMEGAE